VGLSSLWVTGLYHTTIDLILYSLFFFTLVCYCLLTLFVNFVRNVTGFFDWFDGQGSVFGLPVPERTRHKQGSTLLSVVARACETGLYFPGRPTLLRSADAIDGQTPLCRRLQVIRISHWWRCQTVLARGKNHSWSAPCFRHYISYDFPCCSLTCSTPPSRDFLNIRTQMSSFNSRSGQLSSNRLLVISFCREFRFSILANRFCTWACLLRSWSSLSSFPDEERSQSYNSEYEQRYDNTNRCLCTGEEIWIWIWSHHLCQRRCPWCG